MGNLICSTSKFYERYGMENADKDRDSETPVVLIGKQIINQPGQAPAPDPPTHKAKPPVQIFHNQTQKLVSVATYNLHFSKK